MCLPFQIKAPFFIPFCSADVDYEELTDVPVVFAPGVNTQVVTLITLTDPVKEGDETLTATITTTQRGVEITVPQANITLVDSCGMCYMYILTFYFTIMQAVCTLMYGSSSGTTILWKCYILGSHYNFLLLHN